MIRPIIIAAVAAVALADEKPVFAAAETLSWEKWQPLIGDWKAEGKGNPGQGAGSFSFAFELQKKIILRKSHTDYPAAEGRPAFAHDDLMIIYADEASHHFRADYFDNEGHVIRYTAEFSADGTALTFVSDPVASQPTFRLVYTITSPSSLGIKFEIAPPNAPDQFKVYVEGQARK